MSASSTEIQSSLKSAVDAVHDRPAKSDWDRDYRSSPATAEVARSGAPDNSGALPHRHGRREDAMDRTHDAAPTVRGDFSNQTPPPPGAEWNVSPDAPHVVSAQVWSDRWADLAIRNLRSLRQWIEEHRDGLNLSETATTLERINDELRMITLAGISDAPLVQKGRLLDERA